MSPPSKSGILDLELQFSLDVFLEDLGSRIYLEDLERGVEFHFSCCSSALLFSSHPLNIGRTDRKVDQILVSDRTEEWTDGRNKHIVGLLCFQKLSSEFRIQKVIQGLGSVFID